MPNQKGFSQLLVVGLIVAVMVVILSAVIVYLKSPGNRGNAGTANINVGLEYPVEELTWFSFQEIPYNDNPVEGYIEFTGVNNVLFIEGVNTMEKVASNRTVRAGTIATSIAEGFKDLVKNLFKSSLSERFINVAHASGPVAVDVMAGHINNYSANQMRVAYKSDKITDEFQSSFKRLLDALYEIEPMDKEIDLYRLQAIDSKNYDRLHEQYNIPVISNNELSSIPQLLRLTRYKESRLGPLLVAITDTEGQNNLHSMITRLPQSDYSKQKLFQTASGIIYSIEQV